MHKIDRYSAWIPPQDCKGKSFLDIGCREGSAGLYVLTNGASQYVGIDVDKQQTINAMHHIADAHPGANAKTMAMSIEEYLNHYPTEFDVIILGNVIGGISNLANILSKLAVLTDHIIVESVGPLNSVLNDLIVTYATPEILYNLEYETPIAEIYSTDWDDDLNNIKESRYLHTVYSIGYLTTLFKKLGFSANLDSYEKLKKQFPNVYGYGLNSDKTRGKHYVINFNTTHDPTPLSWSEWNRTCIK